MTFLQKCFIYCWDLPHRTQRLDFEQQQQYWLAWCCVNFPWGRFKQMPNSPERGHQVEAEVWLHWSLTYVLKSVHVTHKHPTTNKQTNKCTKRNFLYYSLWCKNICGFPGKTAALWRSPFCILCLHHQDLPPPFSPPFFMCMYVCLCMFAHAWGAHVCGVYMYVWTCTWKARGWHWKSSSIALYLSHWGRIFSWTLTHRYS